MPAYAGFKNLRDYLERRFAQNETNQNAFSNAMGWRRNYINGVMHGQFSPSLKRCDQIADFFSDDPHLVRVLAGLESLPPDTSDRLLREIYDIAKSLDNAKRKKAIKLLLELGK